MIKNIFLLGFVVFASFFGCDSSTSSKVLDLKKELGNDVVILKQEFNFPSKEKRNFYYSYSILSNCQEICFDYSYDSTVVAKGNNNEFKNENEQDGYLISIRSSLKSIDTMYYHLQMDSAKERIFNENRICQLEDSIKVSFGNFSYVVLKYKRKDDDPRWDEDYFISPNFGILYINYYHFNSTIELSKHPDLGSKVLGKIIEEIKKSYK